MAATLGVSIMPPGALLLRGLLLLPHKRQQILILLILAAATLRAQEPRASTRTSVTPTTATTAPIASSDSTEKSEVPEVPGINGFLRGFNAGLTFAGVHDRYNGWATIAQPAIAYSFNSHFAVDVTIPIYMYRLAESQARNPKPNALLVNQRGEPGDLLFGFHAQFLPRFIQDELTFSVSAPTGDQVYGLTSGKPTFDLTNRVEHNFLHSTPNLEIGLGDSSTLVNRIVNKNYTTLGPLAHFQIGVALPLPFGTSFETNVYEQLPIGDQKLYRSVIRKGAPLLVVAGKNVTEDNGFTNSFDLPLNGHLTLSAYYSRSLRLKDDIVSVGLTYVLHAAKPRPDADHPDASSKP